MTLNYDEREQEPGTAIEL